MASLLGLMELFNFLLALRKEDLDLATFWLSHCVSLVRVMSDVILKRHYT
jgi:hypothetical protein